MFRLQISKKLDNVLHFMNAIKLRYTQNKIIRIDNSVTDLINWKIVRYGELKNTLDDNQIKNVLNLSESTLSAIRSGYNAISQG